MKCFVDDGFPIKTGCRQSLLSCILLQEFGRVESSVTTKIKGVTRSHLDVDSEDDPGECDVMCSMLKPGAAY